MTSNNSTYEPDEAVTAQWESGELGRSEEHAVVASAEQCAAVDDALGLQLVSIRLQRGLINNLKLIAKVRGVAYQPLIRDLLNRFAISELRNIAHELAEQQRAAAAQEESIVNDFLERERARKHG